MKIRFFNSKLLGFLFLLCAITPLLGTERRLKNTISDLNDVKYDLDRLFRNFDNNYSRAFGMVGLNIAPLMNASQKLGGATVEAISEVCNELLNVCGDVRELRSDMNRLSVSSTKLSGNHLLSMQITVGMLAGSCVGYLVASELQNYRCSLADDINKKGKTTWEKNAKEKVKWVAGGLLVGGMVGLGIQKLRKR